MQIFKALEGTKVLVVGDIMLDRYWWGSVGRISPEAPVPVVRLVKQTLAAGGAANVALNVAGLGATPLLVGVVGSDDEARLIRKELEGSGVDAGHLIEIPDRPTTVKTRVIAHSQQVARIDQETDADLDVGAQNAVTVSLAKLVPMVDVVIVSDYAKGLLTVGVLNDLRGICKNAGKSIFVDPKGKDYQKYSGATMITPNRREAAEACNFDENSENMVERAGVRLIDDLNVDAVLITQGEAGMTLFRRDQPSRHFPAAAREVYDVTGAGDTVIATLASTIGAGADLETATDIANVAAGLVVEQVGTTPITTKALTEYFISHNEHHSVDSLHA
jgi:D-beta-D-heptose 7-phosphate kinase/D-beta-D-heptose 1-phosphate adenosyltransferase